jgi:glycosyltransferase involved in cell wall biosynthesis
MVLTGSGREYPLQDPSLLQGIHPSVKVVRADLPRGIQRHLPALTSRGSSAGSSFFKRLGFRFWIYDDFYPWILPACRRGIQILKDFAPDAILATGSPFCSLIAADLLSALKGVPLLVDFRDGWHECAYRRSRGSLPRRLEGILERRILRRCRTAFFVTRGLLEQYHNKYPSLAHKFVWLPNGYRRRNLRAGLQPSPQEGHLLQVKYIGQFTPYRRPDAFLRGLAKAVRDLGCSNLAVEFVGGLDEKAWALIQSLGLQSAVRVTPFVPHEEAERSAWSADVLLLLVDRTPGYRVIQTGKIFEYMPSRRPILCISPLDSEAARTVAREGLGVAVPPEDQDGIAGALARWAHEKKTFGAVRPNLTALPGEYDQERLSARLVHCLDEILGNSANAIETAAQCA